MSLYNRGQCLDWFTPVSKCEYLHFEKLIDDVNDFDTISIIVERFITADKSERYCFRWKHFVAYRNTLEEHYLPWEQEAEGGCNSSPTYMVANSSWIADLRNNNDYLDSVEPNLKHYVIGTDSYWTEVISNTEPEIIKLE